MSSGSVMRRSTCRVGEPERRGRLREVGVGEDLCWRSRRRRAARRRSTRSPIAAFVLPLRALLELLELLGVLRRRSSRRRVAEVAGVDLLERLAELARLGADRGARRRRATTSASSPARPATTSNETSLRMVTPETWLRASTNGIRWAPPPSVAPRALASHTVSCSACDAKPDVHAGFRRRRAPVRDADLVVGLREEDLDRHPDRHVVGVAVGDVARRPAVPPRARPSRSTYGSSSRNGRMPIWRMTVNVWTVPTPASTRATPGRPPHAVHSARGYHWRCPHFGHSWISSRPSAAAFQYGAVTSSGCGSGFAHSSTVDDLVRAHDGAFLPEDHDADAARASRPSPPRARPRSRAPAPRRPGRAAGAPPR